MQNYVLIKMSEIQDSHSRVHMTVDEAYFRIGKIAKLGAARAGVTCGTSQPPEPVEVSMVEDKEENEACKSMVKTLGQRSDTSLSSEASGQEEKITQRVRPKTSKSRAVSVKQDRLFSVASKRRSHGLVAKENNAVSQTSIPAATQQHWLQRSTSIQHSTAATALRPETHDVYNTISEQNRRPLGSVS